MRIVFFYVQLVVGALIIGGAFTAVEQIFRSAASGAAKESIVLPQAALYLGSEAQSDAGDYGDAIERYRTLLRSLIDQVEVEASPVSLTLMLGGRSNKIPKELREAEAILNEFDPLMDEIESQALLRRFGNRMISYFSRLNGVDGFGTTEVSSVRFHDLEERLKMFRKEVFRFETSVNEHALAEYDPDRVIASPALSELFGESAHLCMESRIIAFQIIILHPSLDGVIDTEFFRMFLESLEVLKLSTERLAEGAGQEEKVSGKKSLRLMLKKYAHSMEHRRKTMIALQKGDWDGFQNALLERDRWSL